MIYFYLFYFSLDQLGSDCKFCLTFSGWWFIFHLFLKTLVIQSHLWAVWSVLGCVCVHTQDYKVFFSSTLLSNFPFTFSSPRKVVFQGSASHAASGIQLHVWGHAQGKAERGKGKAIFVLSSDGFPLIVLIYLCNLLLVIYFRVFRELLFLLGSQVLAITSERERERLSQACCILECPYNKGRVWTQDYLIIKLPYFHISQVYAFKILDFQISQKIIHAASFAFSTFVHSVSDCVKKAEPTEASS